MNDPKNLFAALFEPRRIALIGASATARRDAMLRRGIAVTTQSLTDPRLQKAWRLYRETGTPPWEAS